MKSKTWYYKTELGGKVTFKLTELGISIPKVMKSYMEYYGIPQEYLFKYSTDCNSESEFKTYPVEKIKAKMKSAGATDSEIEEAVDEFLNFDSLIEE